MNDVELNHLRHTAAMAVSNLIDCAAASAEKMLVASSETDPAAIKAAQEVAMDLAERILKIREQVGRIPEPDPD